MSERSAFAGRKVGVFLGGVVGAICPPVIPYTELFMNMTVMFSPRLAAWMISDVPMAAMSPSPW